MGYGFVAYKTKKSALNAIKKLQVLHAQRLENFRDLHWKELLRQIMPLHLQMWKIYFKLYFAVKKKQGVLFTLQHYELDGHKLELKMSNKKQS